MADESHPPKSAGPVVTVQSVASASEPVAPATEKRELTEIYVRRGLARLGARTSGNLSALGVRLHRHHPS